ncbi:MAG: hypothetical protein AB1503_11365 [Bacillota bacterium]
MDPAVYSGDIDADGLKSLIASLRPQAPYAVLQRVDAVGFPGAEEVFDPVEWEEGRIFGPGVELHWQRGSWGFRVALTREDGGEGAGLAPVPLPAHLRRQEHGYYLWGEDETRIGRSLRYLSLAGHGRPRLTVAEFYDQNRELCHWRYVGMGREP